VTMSVEQHQISVSVVHPIAVPSAPLRTGSSDAFLPRLLP
jgi:hypothetical protein